MSDTDQPVIETTRKIALRPWGVPTVAVAAECGAADVPVSELTDEALCLLVDLWITQLYARAGKPQPTFYASR